MEKIMVKTTNWIKGLALLGMMVALVGMLAVAPGASAASVSTASTDTSLRCPATGFGKINVVAVDAVKGDAVANATIAVYRGSAVILKGTTDANGTYSNYICTGTYKVRVFANGYKEFSQEVTITWGQSTLVKAALSSDISVASDR